MADTERVKTKREQLGERLKKRYPDKEYADDEALFGQINDDYDQYDQDLSDRDGQIQEYQDREDKLTQMMASDPRSASLLVGMQDGEDPAVGLMRRFGPELRDILDDPEKQEELSKAQAEYLERVAKEKELEETYSKNLAESLTMLEEYQQENGLSDEQIDALMEQLITVANDMVVGKFSRETIEMFGKALSYESDMATARSEGEVAGRNAKISEKLRRRQQGDGTAQLGSPGGGGKGGSERDLGALGRYDAGSRDIWERGGMKRVKRG